MQRFALLGLGAVLLIFVIFTLSSCKKRGDLVTHKLRYEVSSDTTHAYFVTIQLIKNFGKGGDEIIANTPQNNVPLPFVREVTVTGVKKYDSYNYALTAEVKKTSKLTLKVFIDGKLKSQQTGIRMDFVGEHGIDF